MRRIIYLNPFSRLEISGGIKECHRQVELLTELGYQAYVWQPDGRPVWFDSTSPLLGPYAPADIRADDILIFPEVLAFEPLPQFLFSASPCTKILFCQNQHYCFNKWVPLRSYAELGISGVFCGAVACKRFLEDVFRVKDVALLPYFIDRSRFAPSQKRLQIAAVTKKLPEKSAFITNVFYAKFPEYWDVPCVRIDQTHENQYAKILGESAILLSLNHRESFGLSPVEAMSAGCLVAGFHGFGGLEYADAENGLWYSMDDEEAVAEGLGTLVAAYKRGDPLVERLRQGGARTADRYGRDSAKMALDNYFSGLGARKSP